MADYAVVILAEMARDTQDTLMTATWLSSRTALPEPTVAKVLKLLARGEVLCSVRGANGGYRLALTPDTISMARVLEALEGPVALTACVEGGGDCCSYSGQCAMKGKWDPVNIAMKQALEAVTLAHMIAAVPQREKTL